jgi:hypothetical protein
MHPAATAVTTLCATLSSVVEVAARRLLTFLLSHHRSRISLHLLYPLQTINAFPSLLNHLSIHLLPLVNAFAFRLLPQTYSSELSQRKKLKLSVRHPYDIPPR